MRISSARILISALINSGDVEAARNLGITIEHMQGYESEYQWLLNYPLQYDNQQPSRDIFLEAFPNFLFSPHEDIRSAVDALFKTHYSKLMVANIETAMKMMDVDLDEAYATLTAAKPRKTTSTPRSLVTDLSFFDDYGETEKTITIPMETVQRNTRGIGPGQLWYLGGRTGEGKSAYLCDWAVAAICQGKRVKFYSLEMTEMEIRGRIHAILARRFNYKNITSFGILHRTVDKHDYKTFVGEIDDKIDGVLHVHTPKQGTVTPGVIGASAENYDLVIADHVGLVQPDGSGHATDDWRTAARISNSFKEIALRTGTPILAAAQINREGAHGTQPPDLKNLAGTDSLGQDADVVVTLRAMGHDVATVFRLPKNRHGNAKMKWWCRFDPNNGDFREISHDAADTLEMDAADDD